MVIPLVSVMTVAGLRLSRRANAVSALHGETARHMWADVEGAAPIISITNGVHAPTWQAPAIREAADRRNLNAIDATCPLVTKVHLEAVRFAREGYTILLIGHEGHDEVLGTTGEGVLRFAGHPAVSSFGLRVM